MRSRRTFLGLLVICAIGLLLIQLTVELPEGTILLSTLNNSGHIPLFGALSLILLALSRTCFGGRRWRDRAHYSLALTGSCALAIATEGVQYYGPRDADLGDLLLDLAGAAAFLCLFGPLILTDWKSRSAGRGIGHVVRISFGVLLLLTAFSPLLLWGVAYLQRDASFPRICSFESYWERKFLAQQDASLRPVPPPAGWMNVDGRRVGELTLHPAGYPGFSVMEPYPDWRGHEEFVFTAYLELKDSVRLVLRVHDATHDQSYHDRFNMRIVVAPGANSFAIPLERIRTAPREREMDMARIANVTLFAVNPPESFSVYIDNLHLR